MAERFRMLRSVAKSYEEQGEIYFTCVNYARQPERVRRKIDALCQKAGGEYAAALKEFMTSGAGWKYICWHYHISDATLDRLRRRFYELW